MMMVPIIAIAWLVMQIKKTESSRDISIVKPTSLSVPRAAPAASDTSRDEELLGETEPSGEQRQPALFREAPVAPDALFAVLATGKPTVDARVHQLQRMRGISLSQAERERALAFLSGKDAPTGIGQGSLQWLADELLTVLRQQNPPWPGLAAALGETAYQPGIHPVVRDYIMQHLGHLWEQAGPRPEIREALWKALDTTDETTPGTALIALSKGFTRDAELEDLAATRERAMALVTAPSSTLAVRVTALTIAAESGSDEVKELAKSLVKNPQTPFMLKNVAERALR